MFEAVGHLHAIVAKIVQARAQTPGEDIISELVEGARARGIDSDQLVTLGSELIAGGIITTAQLISNAMMLLLRNADQLDAVRTNPKLIAPMLDETLRLESPVQSKFRRATRDVEIAGVKVAAGSNILLVLAAGNRDPTRFPGPRPLSTCSGPRSTLKRHFGFGLGAHFCLGAPLARTEARIAFEHLLPRLPRPSRLDDARNDFSVYNSSHFRAVKELTLLFEPV